MLAKKPVLFGATPAARKNTRHYTVPCTKEMRSTVETLGYRVGRTHEAKKAKLPKGFIAPLGCLGHPCGPLCRRLRRTRGKCTTGQAKTTASDDGVLNAHARRLHLSEKTNPAH